MSKDYEVTVVNPSNPRRRRRSTKKRRSSGAQKNPRRRLPQRNPVVLGFNVDAGLFTRSALRTLGKVGGALAVKLFAGGVGEPVSETTGARWSWWSHVLNLGGGMAMGALLRMFLRNPGAGQLAVDGAVDQSMQKAFWSEIVHSNTILPKWLGQIQASEGDILENDRGGRWVRQGGRWVTMMAIEQKDALDGLEYANALGRPRGRRRGMGHLMPASSSTDEIDRGRMIRSGDADPYSAAYQ